MNKKSLTLTTILVLILLVIGFGLVLLFYTQISWTGLVDKEICHQSVIYRATLPEGTQTYIPLKCKTEKICITAGLIGGKCENKFGSKERVVKVKVKDITDIEKAISQSIVDCWRMMGEGQATIFSQGVVKIFGIGGTVYPSCVICSRIAFDTDKLDKAGITKEKLKDVNVMRYMRTRQIPGEDLTYYEYLIGTSPISLQVKDNNIPEIKEDEVTGDIKVETTTTQEKEPEPDAELSIVFMQISAPEHWEVGRNTIATAVGGVAAGTFLTGGAFLKTAFTAATSKIFLATAAIFGIYQQANVAYNRAVTAGYCGDVSVGTEARGGCSVVRTVNYQLEDIASYCQVIESIP